MIAPIPAAFAAPPVFGEFAGPVFASAAGGLGGEEGIFSK